MINSNLPETFAEIGRDIGELRKVGKPSNEFFIFTGQSNMQRHEPYQWEVPDNLFIFNNIHTDPDSVGTEFVKPTGEVIGTALAVSAECARQNPSKNVYVLLCAIGGRTIESWLPGGDPDIFGAISANLPLALAEAGMTEVTRMFWWQGETGGWKDTYGNDFATAANRFKGLTGFNSTTPWTIFGVTDTARGGETRYDKTNMWLQKIVHSKPAQYSFFPTYSLNSNSLWDDAVHLNGDGYYLAGKLAYDNRFNHLFGNSSNTAVVWDANSLSVYNGTFTVKSTTENLPVSSAGTLEHEEYNPNFCKQVYTQSTTGIQYTRYKKGGIWDNWLCTRAAVRCVLTSNQSVSTDDVVQYIALGGFDNLTSGTYFYPKAGYWRIEGSVRISSAFGSNDVVTAQIFDYNSNSLLASSENTGKQVAVSKLLLLDGSEQIGIRVKFSTGGSHTLQGSGFATYFSAEAY